MILTFDIETIPCQDAELVAEWRAELTAEMELAKLSVKAPANYKDQEKIDAYIADKINELVDGLDSALDAKVAKTSFDGLFGRVACIAWAFGDGEICCTGNSSEQVVIAEFYDAISVELDLAYQGGHTSTPLQVCGHNIAGFDLPFLKARSVIHGIQPPPGLWRAMKAKPWDECIQDTMLLWSSDNQKRVKMDTLCRVLGIKGKDGFDGSMVAETWPINPKKVMDYCKDDVHRTRSIYKRLTFRN